MCGIVGVVGNRKAQEIIVTGLSRLEYRGYDSAGLALMDSLGMFEVRKAVGKLAALKQLLAENPPSGAVLGIGHTRWATHGTPSEVNAHPHTGRIGNHHIAVVHNGIIENYQELRQDLTRQGAQFQSQTDTETIPYAIAGAMESGNGNLAQSVHTAVRNFRGSFAFVAMQEGEATRLVGTRRGAPLCVGVGEGANYFASDPFALAGVTSKFIFLEDDDVATLTSTEISIVDAAGHPVTRPVKTLDLSDDIAGKHGFKHFMLKEVNEQPTVASRLLQAFTNAETFLPNLPLENIDLSHITHINIVACGTAYYAGQVGKYYLEQFARIPVNVDVASEFRYRNPPFAPGGLFIAVSQSGETADTLAALEHAKAAGQTILTFTNATQSSMARTSHAVIDLMAGREVAVASTKAFTAMIIALALFALQAARARGLSEDMVKTHIQSLRQLPTFLTDLLSSHTEQLTSLAERLTEASHMLYLGRGLLAPMAYEGALKMKEISYIHAEGYASGEMKHGPIALVDKTLPVINLASGTDGLFEKTVSNLKEVEARNGQVILITDVEGAQNLDPQTREKLTLITVPTVPPLLLPMVFAVPLQLLAYYTATAKGTDVDQPRNLAKSVTVE